MEKGYDRVDELDLLEMLHILRNRWWIVVVCLILAVGISVYFTFEIQMPVYRAETTLFAGKEPNKIASLDISDLNLNQRLVQDYREIVLSRLVARQVIEELNMDMTIENFQNRVSVETVRDSRFFKIAFESTKPQMAMDTANVLGQMIIDKADEIIDVKNVIVIDSAELPKEPIKPNKKLNISIAALLGVMLGVFLIYFLEFLDRTIKTDRDVEKYLGLSTIGEIPSFKREGRRTAKSDTSKALITLADPKAPASEAYRSLRTNIGYTSVDREVKTIVVTSAGPGEGKSTTAVNLAVSLAQVGKKVLIIDGDLRKAKVHRYFSIPNDYGVTDIIINKYKMQDAVKEIESVANLYALCCGTVPPNPAEILASQSMTELLETARKDFDIVLIDMPPVSQLTDAAIIARNADGVILVAASGETYIEMAQHAKSKLDKVKANVLGAVLTKIKGSAGGAYYYKYYGYDRYYYSD